jgi:hypothetical protein
MTDFLSRLDKYLNEEDEKKPKKTYSLEDAKRIGDKLGVTWEDFDVEEFHKGLLIEREHGTINPDTNVTDDDDIKTAKITLAHLAEDSQYNTHLLEMEQKYSKKNK